MKIVLKERLKTHKGITLIALVITIIVLLILAGVAIATLTGDNGIIAKAQQAKMQNDKANEKEQIDLAVLASKINNDASIDKKTLRKELDGISNLIESGIPTSDEYSFPLILVGKTGTEYEIDEDAKESKFKYEVVNTEEIIPVYDNGLERKLKNIIRYYKVKEEVLNQLDEITYAYIEYWTDNKMIRWKMKDSFTNTPIEESEDITHTLGDVPFIEFSNNKEKQSDLEKIKSLLDLKDVVVSGFANDIEDIQQIIYILENYGGTDLNEFLSDLKRYKTVKTESIDGNSGGLSTLSIDIPVEARNVLIEYLKKQIYESGQGLQQDIEVTGSVSGVALKFYYRKLELKSGLLETEFRTSINHLIKAILKFLGITENYKIAQTYTRNMISNDL